MRQPRIFEPKVRQLVYTPLQVGESPVWDERTGDLWFVDIPAPAIFRLRSNGKLDRFDVPSPVGCLGLCQNGLIVAGMKSGIYLLAPETGRLEKLCDPDAGRPFSRLNDGKIGPDGHFWVGTRDEGIPPTGNARLYRVSAQGTFETIIDGDMLTSNGLAWSPNGTKMYHSDSSGLFLQSFEFNPATGTIGQAVRLHDFLPEEGRPDGGAVDSEGCYWSAGVQGGRINRFTPDGELFEIYRLPFKGPTMPCFGGRDLKTMYLTSLATEEKGTRTAGTLVSFEAPVTGLAINRFGQGEG